MQATREAVPVAHPGIACHAEAWRYMKRATIATVGSSDACAGGGKESTPATAGNEGQRAPGIGRTGVAVCKRRERRCRWHILGSRATLKRGAT